MAATVSFWLAGLAAATALALAILIVVVRPRAGANRVLALLLAAEGIVQLSALPEHSVVADFGWVAGASVLPWLYLLFLGSLPTPRVRWLGSPVVRAVIVGAILANLLAIALAAPGTLRGDDPVWGDALFVGNLAALIGVSVFAVVATVSAWRRAPLGTLARERMAAYAAAFVTRDVLFITGIGLLIVLPDPGNNGNPISLGLTSIGTLCLAVLLAYGIFRLQLFDIQARVRWTISRGLLVTVFVAAFVIGSQLVSAFVTPRYGLLAGLAGTVLLLPALLPLKRAADRLAQRAAPDVGSTRTRSARQLEIYQAALAEFGGEGTAADKAYLARLRTRLGLDDRDHAVLARAARPSGSTTTLAPGAELLGRFRLVKLLGEGAEGRTFLAEDHELQRQVVVKALHPQLGLGDALREARALAAVRHPAIAAVHDVQRIGDEAVIVMEFIPGGSLKQRLDAGPLPDAAWQGLARRVLEALAAIHAGGLVHGDIKPSNVLLEADGHAKVSDFGIARNAGDERTRTSGVASGTPRYMSPEQARGAPPSVRGDLYAAALMLLEARHGSHEVPPSDPLATWFARALDPSPARRFTSAEEMRAALGRAG